MKTTNRLITTYLNHTKIVVVCGGGRNRGDSADDSVEYLSKNNKWGKLPKMNEKRDKFDAVVIDSEIFAVGGARVSITENERLWGRPCKYTATVESLKIGEPEWKTRQPMIFSREGHAVAVGNLAKEHSFFVFGGRTDRRTGNFLDSRSVHKFDVKNDKWIAMNHMLYTRLVCLSSTIIFHQ